MTQSNCKIINGYIEGFYGKLLNWKDRERILERLENNKMFNYLYAPKEDALHRNNWRKPYDKIWNEKFKIFCKSAKTKKINIIFGISPGLDFNFSNLDKIDKNHDFILLLEKCLYALQLGANSIVLQFDDIPDHFYDKYKTNLSEGASHAKLANELSMRLNTSIYVIPRIYSDELIKGSKNYLLEFGFNLNNTLKIFYCGINVVEKKINIKSKKIVSKFLKNQVVFWDNFYANDYCPRRLFIGPWKDRCKKMDIMINPTGLIETDLIIIDIVGNSLLNSKAAKSWKEIILKNKIPKDVFKIKKYFESPDFTNKPLFKAFKYAKKDVEALDRLLWNWQSDLSREWYPFLMGLKLDLQINLSVSKNGRIIKTQTNPLVNKILK